MHCIYSCTHLVYRMGALPWTLQTSDSNDEPKVITSESCPLPKTEKVIDDNNVRRGSLNIVQSSTQETKNEEE